MEAWARAHPAPASQTAAPRHPHGQSGSSGATACVGRVCSSCAGGHRLPEEAAHTPSQKHFERGFPHLFLTAPQCCKAQLPRGYKCHQGAMCPAPCYHPVRTAQQIHRERGATKHFDNAATQIHKHAMKNRVLLKEAEEHERQQMRTPTLRACFKCPWLDPPSSASAWKAFPSFLSYEDCSPGQGTDFPMAFGKEMRKLQHSLFRTDKYVYWVLLEVQFMKHRGNGTV